jgi:hypothetical protein
MTLRTAMTPRRTRWALAVAAVVVAACAAIGLSYPNEYDCPAFAIRGGTVTSMELRHVTCEGASEVVRAVHRGTGDASPGGSALVLRKWRCSDAAGLTSCTRPGGGFIRAHVRESAG